MAPPEPPLLTLNVGGQLFTALRATLRSRPDSLLSAMFSGEWEPTAVRDERGHPYIDRDPDHFPAILRFMRDGTAPVPADAEKRQALRAEAAYFGCWPLVEAIGAAEERYTRIEAAREQRLLAEACLAHELAELVRAANSEAEAAAAAVDAARAKMVALNADMKAATAEAQAADRELQGGAAVVPPAERLRHRRRLHAAAVRWHALQDQYEDAARALDGARRRQRVAQLAKLAAIQVVVPPQADDSSDDEDEEPLPRHLHPEEPIGWRAPPADFEEWEEAEAQRMARQAAAAAAAAEGVARRAAGGDFFGLGGGFPFAGGFGVGDNMPDFGFGIRPRPPAVPEPGAAPEAAPPAPAAAPVAPFGVGGAAPQPVAFGFGGAFNFRERLLRDPLAAAAPPAAPAPAAAAQAAPAPPAAANPVHALAGGNAAGAARLGEEGAPGLPAADVQLPEDGPPARAASGPAAHLAAAPAPAQPQSGGLVPGGGARAAPAVEPSDGPAGAGAPAPGEEGAAPPAAETVDGPAAVPEEVPAPAGSPPARQARGRRGRAAARAATQHAQLEQQEQEQVPANRPATRARGARQPAADKQEQEPAGRARRRGRADAA